jgi:hypothetical protein
MFRGLAPPTVFRQQLSGSVDLMLLIITFTASTLALAYVAWAKSVVTPSRRLAPE